MDETVSRYIACRPLESAAEAGGATHEAWLEDVRGQLRAGAAALSQVSTEPAASLAEISPEPDRGGFVTLPELNALVIEPPAGTPQERVRELLHDDYVVAPDFALSLPESALGTPVAPGEVLPILDVVPDCTAIRASHEAGNKGGGAVVAILDTGCDAGHREFAGRDITFGNVSPDERAQVRRGLAFDSGTHGTHVAGIVGGQVVGIAPEADLICATVMESDTVKTTALRVIKAIYWTIDLLKDDRYKDKPVILNLSLGFDPDQIPESMRTSLDEILVVMRRLMQGIVSLQGILPVVAIGNSGPDTACAPGFFPESLAVGAIDYTNASWVKSSGGRGAPGFEQDCNPDIVGYGVEVVSGVPRLRTDESPYERKSGTSMAAPYVSAIAALVAGETGLRGMELRQHLLDHAVDVGLNPERAGAGLARYAV